MRLLQLLHFCIHMGSKILIADDSKLVVSLIRSIFENEKDDFTVITASDGKEAIEKAENELPDIILMDWQMPELSGIESLKLLKQNEKTKSIPVIMLTATESTNEAFEFGANDFVQKPFEKTELIARIKTSLELANSQKELKLKNVDLEIQHNKLKIQKDILVKQKKELGESQELAIIISRIIEPTQNILEQILQEHFLLTIPVSEIPSNFLWGTRKGRHVLFCIGFMAKNNISTILFSSGILNILNFILNSSENEKDLQPSQILMQLNERLKSVSDANNSILKGRDLIFCSIDLDKKSMQYSGVNIPVFVIKNNKLVELKTVSSKTGINDSDLNLTNHKVQLAKGDLIYILNDGFNQNRTGMKESSYVSDESLNVLKKIYKKEMGKQKELFEKTFRLWKKELKQTNDILALGIKI